MSRMLGEITNRHGERLDYSFHEGDGSKRVVVLGHGVTGNKDRPFLVLLAEGLAEAGIAALRFSFSGNGESGGRFADATISKEVDDLGSVLDILEGYTVCYGGHSMGGAVGVLRASEDERIRYLVSLAGMVHTKAFAAREFGDVTPDEGNMWDDAECPLSLSYMDDLSAIDTVVEHGGRISVPWLLVHGTDDDVVPLQDSRDIYASAHEPKQLVEIDAADHVFSADAAPKMAGVVVEWVTNHML